MQNMPIVFDGILKADGTLEFNTPPNIPPGPVRVTLQPLDEKVAEVVRLPDLPHLDDSIPAPFDLPRPGQAERVQPRPVQERLPEPVQWTEETAE